MRKLRFLALGAALIVTAFATQRPAAAIQHCNVGSATPYSCVCPNGRIIGCVASQSVCQADCAPIP